MGRLDWKPACLCLMALIVLPPLAVAEGGRLYEVTITNLTPGQILSPPVVVSHDAGLSLFELGEPASPELAALAEDADATGLVALLSASDAVRDVVQGAGPVPPGGSATLWIDAGRGKRLISCASMLVTTNDAFAAVRGLAVHPSRTVAALVPAYDAGSEANNELCLFIPGPPCGNPFQRDVAGAEGFVHVNGGVQLIGDLVGSHDWRNPVARITVRPAGRGDEDGDDDDDDSE